MFSPFPLHSIIQSIMVTQSLSAAKKAAGENGTFHKNGKVYIVTNAAESTETKAVLTVPEQEGEADDLTQLKGIGAGTADKMNAEGIYTFAQLAALTDESVTALDEVIGGVGAKVTKWRTAAAELVA